jgi:hypothetical protein
MEVLRRPFGCRKEEEIAVALTRVRIGMKRVRRTEADDRLGSDISRSRGSA